MTRLSVAVTVLGAVMSAGSALADTHSSQPTASATSAMLTPGQYIVVLEDGANQAAAVSRARLLGGNVVMQYTKALRGYAAQLPASALRAIEADRRVRFVAEDREFVSSLHCVNSPSQCVPEGVDRIDADASSAAAGDGSGAVSVNVAVLDSGTDASHPDLNVTGGVNCTGDKLPATADPTGHGTHVGGTIGALDNGVGVVGVAPGARLWSVRVLNKQGRGRESWILCGIDWTTSTRTDPNPTNDVAVANMSLGSEGADDGDCGRTGGDALHLAICNSSAAGVTYVVAAGNGAADFQSGSPASYDEVLTVTAVADYDGRRGSLASPTCNDHGMDDSAAAFSDFATLASDQAHTIAAPGACIHSTLPGSAYFTASGTSMATPHVAGTVALCIAAGTCVGTPAQIIGRIISDAEAYNTRRRNVGYGFDGDPLRPVSGKYYGYLIAASPY